MTAEAGAAVNAAERKLNRKARQAKRLAILKAMQKMRDDGFGTEEIARALGFTPRMAQSHAARHLGITLNTTASRRLAGWVPATSAQAVRKIADRMGRSPSYVVGRLLSIALADHGRVALRILGKEAKAPDHPIKNEKAQVPTKRELQRQAKAAREAEAKERRERERAAEAARTAMKARMRG